MGEEIRRSELGDKKSYFFKHYGIKVTVYNEQKEV